MKKDLVKKALAVFMAMVMTVTMTMNMSLKAYAAEPEKEDITTSSTIETSTVGTMVSLTAVEGTNGATSDEGYAKLFDGKRTSNNFSKWCVTDFINAYVIFSAEEAVYVDGYSFVTGNDNASNEGRNPKSWTLYGCNDSTADRNSGSWEVIQNISYDTKMQDLNYVKYDFAVENQEKMYQYFKLEITEIQDGTVMQLGEFMLSGDRYKDINYTVVEGTYGATSSEMCSNLIDGKYTNDNFSKWCVEYFDNAYVIFSSTEAVYVDGYSFVIGNDSAGNAGRNPKSWTLYGCNDSTAGRNSGSWEVIHSVTDDTILRDINYAKYDYVFNSTNTKYQYFKLEITEIQDGTVMQLGELILSASQCEHVADGTGTVIAPTCTKPGYTIYHCTICDCDYKQNIVSAPGHIIVGYSCTECDAQGDFNVTGGIAGTDYIFDYDNRVLNILTDTELTISNIDPDMAISDQIYIQSDVSANIVLDGVNIDCSGTGSVYTRGSAAFKIADNSQGNVTITLADDSTNILSSGSGCAGIDKNGDYISEDKGKLVITGTGSLTAKGGYDSAGIGGGNIGGSSNITISGGNITAIGGDCGAGIGSGFVGDGSYITINGGTVTAIGGLYSAGIGGGYTKDGANITISGGTVNAIGEVSAAGIGGGFYGNGINISITGGIVNLSAGRDGAAIGGGEDGNGTSGVSGIGNAIIVDNLSKTVTVYGNVTLAEKLVVPAGYTMIVRDDATLIIDTDGILDNRGTIENNGNIINDGIVHNKGTITGYNVGGTVIIHDFIITGGTEDIDYTYIDGCLTILTETPITVANKNPNVTTANIIVVASDVSANITLAGVNIAANSSAFIIADNSKGNVTITLADGTENTLGASLIDCGGIVKTGGDDSGTLTINGSGKLTAIGNWNAAGIGSLGNTNTANIIIESGTIIAHGGGTGAGIGSGYRGTATNIVIKGGSVTAIGGVRTSNTSSGRINVGGAGIGGGAGGSTAGIYIEGGSVLAMVQVAGAKPIGTGHNSTATGVAVTPKCGSESVYLFELDVDGTSEVVVNGNTCYPKKHNDENKLYLYLPSKTLDDPNEIEIGSRTEKYIYNRFSSEWIKVVDVPVVDTTEFIYDGTEKTYLIAESDDYTIQGNKQTNAGTYTVTVTLNGDCVWSDGTTNDKTYDFVINKAEVTVIAKSYNIKVGEDLPTYEYEVVGLVTGETLPVDVTIICNVVDSDTEGIYTIEVSGDGSSENYTFNYVYGTLSVTEKEVVEAPTFTYENGTEFTSSLKITLDCAIDGVIIYYTTDGSTPTMSSTMYTGEIIITETTTIKAIAVKNGMLDSQVITVTYMKQVVEDNGGNEDNEDNEGNEGNDVNGDNGDNEGNEGNEGNDVNGDNTSPSEPDDDSTSSKPGEGIPGVDHFIPVVPDTDDKAFSSVVINYLAMIFAAVASFLARIKRRSKTQ